MDDIRIERMWIVNKCTYYLSLVNLDPPTIKDVGKDDLDQDDTLWVRHAHDKWLPQEERYTGATNGPDSWILILEDAYKELLAIHRELEAIILGGSDGT